MIKKLMVKYNARWCYLIIIPAYKASHLFLINLWNEFRSDSPDSSGVKTNAINHLGIF